MAGDILGRRGKLFIIFTKPGGSECGAYFRKEHVHCEMGDMKEKMLTLQIIPWVESTKLINSRVL